MPSSGPCCCGVPEMPTKHVATRATAARAECVRICWVRVRAFQCAAASLLLKMTTEGLTTSKISVIEQVAYKNKAFAIVF